jgi:hypothetical protein
MTSRAWVYVIGLSLVGAAGCQSGKSSGYKVASSWVAEEVPGSADAPAGMAPQQSTTEQPSIKKDEPPRKARILADLIDPAKGFHDIGDHVQWHDAKTTDNRPFRWAQIVGENGLKQKQRITLIVGMNGDANTGVQPPAVAGENPAPGWDLSHCLGGPANETVTLWQGFMCVHVETISGNAGVKLNPWPFIISTKTIAAGAYSTSYVLQSANLGNGSTREYVFRPNQAAFENGNPGNVSDPETTNFAPIFAHPKDLPNAQSYTKPGFITRPANSSANWVALDPNSDESRFLSDVCNFYKAAKMNANDPAVTWGCK